MSSVTPWETRSLPASPSTFAPDGSEIRLLAQTSRASTVHARLQAGSLSAAICHKTVDEIWYVLAGRGQLWRSQGEKGHQQIDDLQPGISLSIPAGTHFQFRAAEGSPLDILIATIPPWPGAEEAVLVPGRWRSSAPG